MEEYEVLSDTCKIKWRENFEIGDRKYTQVSGYIFNENNELLIVKNEDTWTIPGGHPEIGEVFLDTLNREIMEEACITIKNPIYIGSVEVLENEQVYYQLRYKAEVSEVLDFVQEWEICERKFVKLDELSNYIKWANGITFKSQIETAKKYL